MIAEIYGKISSTGSNLTDRLEDNLTGNVFGALRYLPAKMVLVPFLENAFVLRSAQKKTFKCPQFVGEPQIEFWPHDYPGIEPDIRICLKEESTRPRVVILVEVKYLSGLSSDDDPLKGIVLAEESENQIVRQIKALRDHHKDARKYHIFLTADTVYPSEIMGNVQRIVDNSPAGSSGYEGVDFYWLSWHDLPVTLQEAWDHKCTDPFQRTILSDLRELCADRKGFNRFRGIRLVPFDGTWSFKTTMRRLFPQYTPDLYSRRFNWPEHQEWNLLRIFKIPSVNGFQWIFEKETK